MMKTLDRHARPVDGVGLVLGGILMLLFWSSPVLDLGRPLFQAWGVQLVMHGITNLLLVGGFSLAWLVLPFGGVAKSLWTVGLVLAVIGVATFIGVLAAGLLAIGVAELIAPRNRSAGGALVLGTLTWFLFWSLGARFDSEDSLPLNELERLLASAGLAVIVAGIIGIGLAEISEHFRNGSRGRKRTGA